MKNKLEKSIKIVRNNKAFTLIELLAVIIILGILMIIAIPSVTTYISNSRKNAYIDTAKTIIGGARNLVNNGNLSTYDKNSTYYIPVSCISTETGTRTPYGDISVAYVLVTYTGEGFEYYYTGTDTSKTGIKKIVSYNNINIDDIETEVEDTDIVTNVGIDGREYITIFNNDCTDISNTIKAGPQYNSESGETSEYNPVEYPSGKTKDNVSIGDIVKIDDQEFYVIKRDGDDLYLLARYNLNVGSNLKPDVPEGIQGEGIVGINNDGYTTYGRVAYSETNYWHAGMGTTYPGAYCYDPNDNCAYVYDSNSYLYTYVEAYKTYLNNLGANVKSARLLSMPEANTLRNSGYTKLLFSTSFILGTPFSSYSIYYSQTNSIANGTGFFSGIYCSSVSSYGVRPVIVL